MFAYDGDGAEDRLLLERALQAIPHDGAARQAVTLISAAIGEWIA